MIRRSLTSLVVVAAVGCQAPQGLLPLNLFGAHDMVLVDELPGDGTIASVSDGGVPNQYLFVTSADTNELKVLKNYKALLAGRYPVTAPDPLEALSIPVLNGPTSLFADEGLSANLRRVTGRYVYATREGGAELSVIDATPAGFAQVTRSPLVLPAPITAGVAWLGVGLTQVPDTSSVYLATFDGTNSVVYRLDLPTDRSRRGEIALATPERLLDVGQEAVVALAVAPPFPGRTLYGLPFCQGTSKCLVLATRRDSGKERVDGRTLMVELDTMRTATLAFPGPVRVLKVAGLGRRVHGLLDEEKCDSASCGGALVVDTLTETDGGFPVLSDLSGHPMQPVRSGGALARDLAVASRHDLTDESKEKPFGIGQALPDGGAVLQGYLELGMYSTSNGQIVVYDGVDGVPIDYNGIRTGLTGGAVQIPLSLPDGGWGFYTDDGGVNYTAPVLSLTEEDTTTTDGGVLPYRAYAARATSGPDLGYSVHLEIGDGSLYAQSLFITNQGAIPGLVGLSTSASDERIIRFTPGLEGLAVGDRVAFTATFADGGVGACGESKVSSLSLDAGFAEVDAIPAECQARSQFTVMGAGAQPLIVSGTLDGYIARGTVGETITYYRRYVTRPAGFDGVRPALSLKVESMPSVPGALWRFDVDGALAPYRIHFDFSSISSATGRCATEVPGALLLGELPTYYSSEGLRYSWSVITLFPYTNGIAIAPLERAVADVFRSTDFNSGATCYR